MLDIDFLISLYVHYWECISVEQLGTLYYFRIIYNVIQK